MSLSSEIITSSWAECLPITVSTTATVYTTVWTTELLAANEFSTWEARYTITEVKTGDPADYRRPDIPPCFVETSVHCGRCAEEQDIIITAPSATTTEGVTIDGDGVVASAAAQGAPAEADFPAPTETEAENGTDSAAEDSREEFPPTEPFDADPELAGGGEVPPGAAAFPDDVEFRTSSTPDENSTIMSALGLSPGATDEAVADDADDEADVTIADAFGFGAAAEGDDPAALTVVEADPSASDASGAGRLAAPEAADEAATATVAADETVAAALGIAPEASGDEAIAAADAAPADETVSAALGLSPEASGEADADADARTFGELADETIEIDGETSDNDAAAGVFGFDDEEEDPEASLTFDDILPLLAATSAAPAASGEDFRLGDESDILNEEEALEAELATLTVAPLSGLSTVVVPSSSATSSSSSSSEDDEESDGDSVSGTSSTPTSDDSSDSSNRETGEESSPTSEDEADDGFIVAAAARRTPTQSSTLLLVNALVVGLWVLL